MLLAGVFLDDASNDDDKGRMIFYLLEDEMTGHISRWPAFCIYD